MDKIIPPLFSIAKRGLNLSKASIVTHLNFENAGVVSTFIKERLTVAESCIITRFGCMDLSCLDNGHGAIALLKVIV